MRSLIALSFVLRCCFGQVPGCPDYNAEMCDASAVDLRVKATLFQCDPSVTEPDSCCCAYHRLCDALLGDFTVPAELHQEILDEIGKRLDLDTRNVESALNHRWNSFPFPSSSWKSAAEKVGAMKTEVEAFETAWTDIRENIVSYIGSYSRGVESVSSQLIVANVTCEKSLVEYTLPQDNRTVSQLLRSGVLLRIQKIYDQFGKYDSSNGTAPLVAKLQATLDLIKAAPPLPVFPYAACWAGENDIQCPKVGVTMGALSLAYISKWTYYTTIDDYATWKRADLCCNPDEDWPEKGPSGEACSYAEPVPYFSARAAFKCEDFSDAIMNSIPCCDGSNDCIRCQKNAAYEPTKDNDPLQGEEYMVIAVVVPVCAILLLIAVCVIVYFCCCRSAKRPDATPLAPAMVTQQSASKITAVPVYAVPVSH